MTLKSVVAKSTHSTHYNRGFGGISKIERNSTIKLILCIARVDTVEVRDFPAAWHAKDLNDLDMVLFDFDPLR